MSQAKLPDEILVFDTETGGTDVENDRILTCYAMLQKPDGSVVKDWDWTIDPGVAEGFQVAQGAADVHGMTTEWIAEHGRKDWQVAIREVFQVLFGAVEHETPIVAYNLRFDLSILHHELLRTGATKGVTGLMADKRAIFYDPLVHDKHRDRYRKGNRKLQTVCEFWGIEFNEEEAHAAEYDVRKTGELAWHHLKKDKLTVADLSRALPQWKEEQDASLQDYFRKSGKTNDDGSPIVIDRGWPLITKKGN